MVFAECLIIKFYRAGIDYVVNMHRDEYIVVVVISLIATAAHQFLLTLVRWVGSLLGSFSQRLC